MKILIIGDIHGKDDWKWILEKIDLFDKIIFVGDYVDSFTRPSKVIKQNLYELILLKRKYMDKVFFLLGNHDYAYVFCKSNTSGFRSMDYLDIKEIFDRNWRLFDVAWGYYSENKLDKNGMPQYTLITHAGLTQSYKSNFIDKLYQNPDSLLSKLYPTKDEYNNAPLHEILNYLKDNLSALWFIGSVRGGIYDTGSIIWADKKELIKDRHIGINQIVGHTPSYYIDINEKNGDNIYFIDKKSVDSLFFLSLDL